MGLDAGQLETIKYGALLHDIGKIGIKDSVLLKNGPFTPDEREEMNKHPAKTLCILSKFHFPKNLEQVPLVATYHHEKMDGKGYFEGFAGNKSLLVQGLSRLGCLRRFDFKKRLPEIYKGCDPWTWPNAFAGSRHNYERRRRQSF